MQQIEILRQTLVHQCDRRRNTLELGILFMYDKLGDPGFEVE